MKDFAACLVNSTSLSSTSKRMLLLHCKASDAAACWYLCINHLSGQQVSQWAARSSALSLQLKLCPQAARWQFLQGALSKVWRLT